MRRSVAVLLLLLAAAGCSKGPDGTVQTADVAEEAPAGAEASAGGGVKVVLPQIAYSYRHDFELPGGRIAAVQAAHIGLCDRLGPGRCIVTGMRRATARIEGADGELVLAVQAGLARRFGTALAQAVAARGGVQAGAEIQAEDLSKRIVDTEARLRAKRALADRLMELLRNRQGPVADLVAAEKAVAEVQEEIDAAASWLAEARGRVAMSAMTIRYRDGDALSAGGMASLRRAMAGVGDTMAWTLAMLVTLLAGLVPVALLGGLAWWAVRAVRRARAAPLSPNPDP